MAGSLSRTQRGRRWFIVALVTLAELLLLGLQWWGEHRSDLSTAELLLVPDSVDRVLDLVSDSAVVVPTGIFVQSLQFESASDVHVTGWVWQSGPPCSLGLVLPEAVHTASNIPPDLEPERLGEPCRGTDPGSADLPDSRIQMSSSYFEASLRQSFDYRTYPLDHKTVWVRMWSDGADAFLVPMLGDYEDTFSDSAQTRPKFGLDPAIVLGGWAIQRTFFDYKCPQPDRRASTTAGEGSDAEPFTCPSYNTDFGEDHPVWQGRPELYFNVVIQRRVWNAFITHLLPLAVVASLLFAMMLTVTGDREQAGVVGFSTTSVVAGASGLFFVTLLGHVQLRNEVAGDSVVYLETFHFILYAMIVAVTVNTFWFTAKGNWRPRWLIREDNLWPKLGYWPVLLAVINLFTAVMLAG